LLLQKLKKNIFLFFEFKNKNILKNTKIIKTLHTSALTRSKSSYGAKIATDSKLRGLEKVVFLRSQNHNFEKFRGPKM